MFTKPLISVSALTATLGFSFSVLTIIGQKLITDYRAIDGENIMCAILNEPM